MIWVSDFCRDPFVAAYPEFAGKAATIHNGIDFAAWTPATERRKEVLFVGRLDAEKGCLEAAQGAAKALLDKPDWRVRFALSRRAVDPVYLAAVEAALAPLGQRAKIEFDLQHDAIGEAFSNAAIALVPSVFQEPFGRTAIEAFAGGAALVTSMRGGLKEIAEGYAEPCGRQHRTPSPPPSRALFENPAHLKALALKWTRARRGAVRHSHGDGKIGCALQNGVARKKPPMNWRRLKLFQNWSATISRPFDAAELARLRNAYVGQTLFLLGGGPSLRAMDIAALPRGRVLFMTVNNGYRLFPNAYIPMHAVSDIACYEKDGFAIEQANIGLRFYRSRFRITEPFQIHKPEQRTVFVPARKGGVLKRGFQNDASRGLGNDSTVLIFAAQLGFYLGFARINVLGCDLDYSAPQTYAYEMTQADEAHEQSAIVKERRRAMINANAEFAALRAAFEANGRSLINCGLGGKLDALPRQSFAEALEQAKR